MQFHQVALYKHSSPDSVEKESGLATREVSLHQCYLQASNLRIAYKTTYVSARSHDISSVVTAVPLGGMPAYANDFIMH